MKKPFFARFSQFLEALFAQPLTPTYWLLVVGYLVLGFTLLQPLPRLPELLKDFALIGVMLGLARLFNSPLGRWAWLGFLALLLVLLGLDVALATLR